LPSWWNDYSEPRKHARRANTKLVPMTALFLIEQNVKSLVDMSTAVDVVQEAFLQWADGRAMNVSRRRAKAPGIVLHSLCAGAEYLGYVGWKNYTTTKHGAKFHVAIYDNETGEMAAFIKADYLGQLRTGAASGVATAAMARPESRTVGLFGTGGQARTQLEAVCNVRKIDYAEVYSRDESRRVPCDSQDLQVTRSPTCHSECAAHCFSG
jgi:alanine dehydrogenase